MKKAAVVIIVIVVLLAIAIFSAYMIDINRMENNRPVVFSTWGYDYAPPVISSQAAIDSIVAQLDERSKKNIINLDNPGLEEVFFESDPHIYCFSDRKKVIGKLLYKITFNTEQDGILGPMVFFVDVISGELVGAEYRE